MRVRTLIWLVVAISAVWNVAYTMVLIPRGTNYQVLSSVQDGVFVAGHLATAVMMIWVAKRVESAIDRKASLVIASCAVLFVCRRIVSTMLFADGSGSRSLYETMHYLGLGLLLIESAAMLVLARQKAVGAAALALALILAEFVLATVLHVDVPSWLWLVYLVAHAGLQAYVLDRSIGHFEIGEDDHELRSGLGWIHSGVVLKLVLASALVLMAMTSLQGSREVAYYLLPISMLGGWLCTAVIGVGALRATFGRQSAPFATFLVGFVLCWTFGAQIEHALVYWKIFRKTADHFHLEVLATLRIALPLISIAATAGIFAIVIGVARRRDHTVATKTGNAMVLFVLLQFAAVAPALGWIVPKSRSQAMLALIVTVGAALASVFVLLRSVAAGRALIAINLPVATAVIRDESATSAGEPPDDQSTQL